MTEKYIFSNGRFMRKDNTILFIDHEGNKKSLPIEQIECLHIFGEVDFNSKFFSLMGQENIFIHMYNYYDYYVGSFVPRKKQLSGYVDVQQAMHYSDYKKRMYLAKMFVEGAIHHILRNLKRKKGLTEATIHYIEKERSGINHVEKVDELTGIEGRIRRAYYQAFNKMISDSYFHFSKRERRPPTDPLNALISFGNSRMYTTVLTEVYQTTLNPTISYLHQPTSKRYSLCLDISEIFKPLIVDTVIFSLINNRMLNEKHFDWMESYCYLNTQGKQIFLAEYQKKLKSTIKHRQLKRKVSYKNLIKLEAYKIIKHVIYDEIYKPLKAWW
ncbi:type I-B CRISPR-associated endonuclease Cas1b [Thermoflavimicrobium daqui]|uniref:CRISPR-associated endonuclease Cas1 n=1 Tax=Thermoflavimicrobium daqui TaxID=2137476 RepID=A0A364K7D3_9BACL|nr:type I-B CRISPR-associated endonuclease Cas1b [Thermoflavimicrobium daqui]RAL26194.1 subtype I-B CRISPR-associated endonuclease Cas1 [Thermoflavimicrobium daqui]